MMAAPGSLGGFTAPALSRREMDVLRAYALLGDIRQAGQACGIGMQRTKNHLTSVYRKLGAHSGIEALRLIGWLRIPEEDA